MVDYFNFNSTEKGLPVKLQHNQSNALDAY
jgi:hypothetical protein